MPLHLTDDRHPGTLHFAALFEYKHLPPDLAPASAACEDLAQTMVTMLPDGPELTAGLRKLVEAKDCFVRAALLARNQPQVISENDAAAIRDCPTPQYHETHHYCPSCPWTSR
jgi:tRNA U34 5-methylaminomethyl-2-thiouridine-forming methyltransferase MnmC